MEFSLQAALCRNPIAEVGSSAFKLPLLVCRLSSQRPSRIHLGKYSAVLMKSSTGNC